MTNLARVVDINFDRPLFISGRKVEYFVGETDGAPIAIHTIVLIAMAVTFKRQYSSLPN